MRDFMVTIRSMDWFDLYYLGGITVITAVCAKLWEIGRG